MTDLDIQKTEKAFSEPEPSDDALALTERDKILIQYASGHHDLDKRISIIEKDYATQTDLEKKINRLLGTIITIGTVLLATLITVVIQLLFFE